MYIRSKTNLPTTLPTTVRITTVYYSYCVVQRPGRTDSVMQYSLYLLLISLLYRKYLLSRFGNNRCDAKTPKNSETSGKSYRFSSSFHIAVIWRNQVKLGMPFLY